MPIEFEEIPVDVPQIFDTKFQLGNDTKRLAETESEKHYIENEPLTVSAIIDSKTPLEIAELRIVSIEQPVEEFISLPMPVILLPISNTTSFISATIPPELVVSPGISY